MTTYSRFLVRSAAILTLALMAAAIVFNRNQITAMQQESATLLEESSEARQLSLENQQIEGLRAAQVEAQKLRQESEDLPRLRNEVRQLRREGDQLGRLRAENERLSAIATGSAPTAPARPAGFVPAEALTDAGQATPAAAVQTFFWALLQGNTNRLIQCIYRQPGQTDLNFSPEMVGQMMTSRDKMGFPGFGIAEQREVSADEVTVSLQAVAQGSTMPVTAKRVAGEWKVNLRPGLVR